MDFNDNQREAIEHLNGPLLIVAGPGSGKTMILVERVIHLIKNHDKKPESFLLITFTKKAADELRERLINKIGDLAIKIHVSTIHSFCYNILADNPEYHNLATDFKVFDELSQIMFLRTYFKELKLNKSFKTKEAKNIQHFFDKCSENDLDPKLLKNYMSQHFIAHVPYYIIQDHSYNKTKRKKFIKNINRYNSIKDKYNTLAVAYELYIKLLHEKKVLDFSNLQRRTIEILRENDNLLKKLAKKYEFILIDEYQDTNKIQETLTNLLYNHNSNITVVGDEDQSIYGFRGAEVDNFMNFENNYIKNCENSKKICLDVNYRSVANIVDLTDEFIKNNRKYEKELKPNRKVNNSVFLIKNNDRQNEAVRIAQIIKELKERKKINSYSDVMLLASSVKYDMNEIIQELKAQNIPFNVQGSENYLNREEVQTLIFLLYNLNRNKHKKEKFSFFSWEIDWFDNRLLLNDFLGLSEETKHVISENYYDYLDKANNFIKNHNIKKLDSFEDFKKNRKFKVFKDLKRHFTDIDYFSFDSKEDFYKIGIRNEGDINKFLTLKNVSNVLNDLNKERIEDSFNKEKTEFKETKLHELFRRSILNVVYEVLKITGYLNRILDTNLENSNISNIVSDFKSDYTFNELNYTLKVLNIAELTKLISNFEEINPELSIIDFLWFMYHERDNFSQASLEIDDFVKISTIHKSKGLESPVVIVCSMKNFKKPTFDYYNLPTEFLLRNDRCFSPLWLESKQNNKSISNVDLLIKYWEDKANQYEYENRRILYVAMTRAEDLLILSSIKKYKKDSSYLIEIEESSTNQVDYIDIHNLSNLPYIESKEKIKKDKLFNINYSAIDNYKRCPFSYNLSYRFGFKFPIEESQGLGLIIHECVYEIHKLMKNNETLSEVDIAEILSDNWLKVSTDSQENSVIKKETLKNLIIYYNEMKDYCKEIISAEEPFKKIGENFIIEGRIDLIFKNKYDEVEIVDFKSRTASQFEETKVAMQLSLYELALKETFSPDRLSAYTFLDHKRIYVDTSEDYNTRSTRLSKEISKICEKIENKEFPRKRSNFCNTCKFNFLC